MVDSSCSTQRLSGSDQSSQVIAAPWQCFQVELRVVLGHYSLTMQDRTGQGEEPKARHLLLSSHNMLFVGATV